MTDWLHGCKSLVALWCPGEESSRPKGKRMAGIISGAKPLVPLQPKAVRRDQRPEWGILIGELGNNETVVESLP